MNQYIQSIEESTKRRKVVSGYVSGSGSDSGSGSVSGSGYVSSSGSGSDSGYVSGSVSVLPGKEVPVTEEVPVTVESNKENIQFIERSVKSKSIEEPTKSNGPKSIEEESIEEETIEEESIEELSLSNADSHSLGDQSRWNRLTCFDTLYSLIQKKDNKLFLFPRMSENKLIQAREAKYRIILHVETSVESRKNPAWSRVAPVYYTQGHSLKDLVMDHSAVIKNDAKELLMTFESALKYNSFGFRILNIYLVQSNLKERMQHFTDWDSEDKIENENQICDLAFKDSCLIFMVKNYKNGKLLLRECKTVSLLQSNAYSWIVCKGKKGESSICVPLFHVCLEFGICAAHPVRDPFSVSYMFGGKHFDAIGSISFDGKIRVKAPPISDEEVFAIDKTAQQYIGVYRSGKNRYQTVVTYKRKKTVVTNCMLGADAAKAFDMVTNVLKGKRVCGGLNFKNEDEYKIAKENELEEIYNRLNITTKEEQNIVRKAYESSHHLTEEDIRINFDLDSSTQNIVLERISSNFHGVCYQKEKPKPYLSSYTFKSKTKFAGSYMLETDAAKAHDIACEILTRVDQKYRIKMNFKNEDEYKIAKENELEEIFNRSNATTEEAQSIIRKEYEEKSTEFPTVETIYKKLGISEERDIEE